jgi:uncharacterized integral membrane protein
MASRTPTFGALVIASLAGVVGIKYLVGGSLALIDGSMVSSITVSDTIALSLGVGVALCLLAGAFFEGVRWARPAGILTFAAVAGLSVPALQSMDPVIVTETVGMAVSVLYLFVRNPIEVEEATKVDDSESGTRTGSTLR